MEKYFQENFFPKICYRSSLKSLLHGILFLILFPLGLFGQDHQVSGILFSRSALTVPVINGPASGCAGVAGYIYSTEPGMSGYVWTVSAGGTVTAGAGTNSITVTWNSAGNETVSVTYSTASIPGVLNVSVLPSAPAGVSVVASSNPVCAGSAVTFTAIPVNGGTSPVYQWHVNGINVGTNSSAFSYIPSNGDIVGCQLVSNLPCATGNPAVSVPISMVVTPVLTTGVFISASANPVCQGNTVTYTAVPFNGGAVPVYQWKVNGNNAGTNSSGFSFSPVNGDIITCLMSSVVSCPSVNPAVSNAIAMTVSPSQPVGVSIAATANPSCQGSSVTFNATPVNGGASPAYQWKVNGIVTGGNSPIMGYVPVNGDFVTCELTSNASCNVGSPAISNTIAMSILQNQPVSVTISASQNPVCQGNPVTFTAVQVNGGASPFYQWSINGFNVGTNSGTFSFIPANGDVVSCHLTSGLSCTTGNPAVSNPVTMNVSPVLPVNITISASANPVCTGATVTFTAIPYNGGTSPSYL
ncbi:MAG: hypothetical protein WCJ26_12240, partial [bacterium]